MSKIFILFVLFFSCKNSESNNSQVLSVNEIALGKLGEKFERKDNGDYSLCFTSEESGSGWKNTIVIHKKNGELVYGPKKINADIDWFTKSRLIIREYPEVIENKNSTNTFIYYYDLLADKRVEAKKQD